MIIHEVRASFSLSLSRLFCSSLLMWRKNLIMTTPSSVSCRSKVLISKMARLIRDFQSMPDTCSASDLEYQLRAKMAILPLAGVLVQNLQRRGRARSSSFGEPIEWRTNPRGSRYWISSPITEVIPDAFHPSTTMMMGTLRSQCTLWRTPSLWYRGAIFFA
ncbi:MAG: hypothetical protein A4E40_00240 [Methanoregulaceae archaeon PtaU1.Bin059]|nr:MAG: hypothetical protein A4E40_00240 [Methanoregulaceae archaeon PtaU1.Bin059]